VHAVLEGFLGQVPFATLLEPLGELHQAEERRSQQAEDVANRTEKKASHEPLQCQILRGLGVGQEGEKSLENLVFLGSVIG
jgi:hypothetical protein